MRFKYLKAITNLQGIPDQANAVSTYCADAIQQNRNRVMNRNIISQLYACPSEDEIRQVLGLLIGDLESNFGHTPITTDSLPPRPVSAMSPQPTISPQQPQYQLLPVSQPNFIYSHGRRSQFHTPAVSSSDATSSRSLQSHDQSDTFTEGTAIWDQRSTEFGSFGSHQDKYQQHSAAVSTTNDFISGSTTDEQHKPSPRIDFCGREPRNDTG